MCGRDRSQPVSVSMEWTKFLESQSSMFHVEQSWMDYRRQITACSAFTSVAS